MELAPASVTALVFCLFVVRRLLTAAPGPLVHRAAALISPEHWGMGCCGQLTLLWQVWSLETLTEPPPCNPNNDTHLICIFPLCEISQFYIFWESRRLIFQNTESRASLLVTVPLTRRVTVNSSPLCFSFFPGKGWLARRLGRQSWGEGDGGLMYVRCFEMPGS